MNSFASPIFANKAIFPARCWIFTGKVSGFFFTMLGLSFPMVRFLLTLSIVFSSSHVVAGPWYPHEGIDDSGNRFLFGISSTKEHLTVPDIIISCPGIVNVPGSMRHFVYLLLPNELDLDYDAKQTKINSEVTYSGKLEVEIDGIRTDLEVQRRFSYYPNFYFIWPFSLYSKNEKMTINNEETLITFNISNWKSALEEHCS